MTGLSSVVLNMRYRDGGWVELDTARPVGLTIPATDCEEVDAKCFVYIYFYWRGGL